MLATLRQYRIALLYGAVLAAGLFLLRWLELRLTIFRSSWDLYIGAVALLFTGLGIWIATRLQRPQVVTRVETVIVQKEVPVPVESDGPFRRNEAELARLGLSSRELEVLEGMAQGLSNQEIAEQLFVSLNTVKTHASNLFGKLDARRRTQAVERARALGVIR